MALKLAFAGFRHSHIISLWNAAKAHEGIEIVAACEEHAPTRDALAKQKIDITHDDYSLMLEEVDCDAIAIGDYYAKRGPMAISALEAGKHLIMDKPICTRLDELDQIASLAAESDLRIGCQLDLRGSGFARTLRRLIHEGKIGEVHTVTVTGQHGLNLPGRPAWYFEPGKHGGTINDIGIHGFDILEWITGRRFVEVVAARSWNAACTPFPHFDDAGQFMLRMDNNAGVLGDVSYLNPANPQGAAEQYWRMTIHGSQGSLEASNGAKKIAMRPLSDGKLVEVGIDAGDSNSYINDFLNEIAGQGTSPDASTTWSNLRASRVSLLTQEAAFDGTTNIQIE